MRAFVCGCCCYFALFAVAVCCAQPPAAPLRYPDTQGYSRQQAPATNPQSQPVPQDTTAPQPAAPPVALPPHAPPGFQLNPVEQAALDQALDAWQQQSGQVVTFSCPFDRLEYVAAFGPVINNQLAPLNKNQGELTFSKPDKGSFQITKIFTYKEVPVQAGQPQATRRGDWVEQADAVGEHWVCDGKSIYEFRANQKQVIERPLPPQLAGKNVIDGPLPFLFGAESAKLKQRYWMRIDTRNENPNEIWMNALPKFQEQAADFRQVDVILDRNRQLPKAMQVTLPNGDRHVYVFHIDKAKVNATLDRIKQALFERPQTPFGWKHVVENVPVAEAQPLQPQTTR